MTVLLLLGLVALTGVGLLRSAGADAAASDAEREHAIASSLRCPTCQGLSVADSGSPLAQSMREIIAERVAAGESDRAVRAHFVDRYGSWVLLAPPAESGGWLVWVTPVVAVVVGLAVAAPLLGRRRLAQPLRWVAGTATLALVLGALMTMNLGERGEGELASGNLPEPPGGPAEPGSPASGGAAFAPEAADSGAAGPRLQRLRAAVDAEPDDVGTRLALASTAFEAGDLALAREQAEAVLADDPRNADALLLVGLAASSPDDPAGRRALRRFLDVAPPGHPVRPVVREILGGDR